MAEDSNYYEYIAVSENDRDLAFLIDGEATSGVLQADSVNALAFDSGLSPLSGKVLPTAAIGLGALGLLGIGAFGGSGSGSGSGGGSVNPAPADKTPPAAPSISVNTETELAGTAEPGSTVTITDPSDGSTITVVVDASGNWSVPNPLEPGDTGATVTVTDPAGNESLPTVIDGPVDVTAPNAPSAVITDNGDGTITVSGSSEPGATVNVTFPDGSTGSVVVDESGNYTIDSPAGVVQPEGELVVNATDSNGNGPSDNTVVAYDDSVAPNAPSAVITDNGDGTITVSGSSEPGATVNVTFPDGSTGSVVVDESGNYTIDSPAGVVQPEGELVVNATDSNGNGPSDNTVVAYDDSVAPNAPSAVITDNGDGTITVSGSSEPGATVNVTFPDGSTGSVVVDESGNYTIDSPAGVVQPEGELVVNATDSNGNGPSDNTVVAYDDSVAPNAPSAVITDNGDGTITVSGSSEPGATVNVTFPDGSTGSVVVDESGNYTIDSPAGVVQPEGELVVNATDSNGNGPSDNTVVAYDDSVAPNAPSAVITDNGDGTITVSGSSEPGATVNVTFPDGSTGSVVVDESGNYTIDSPAGVVQPEGELVVNATDSNGNGPSDNTVVAYDDSVAPNAPSAVITDNGDGTITVSGSSEPGATVNVTFPDGSTGSVVVDESGNYTIDSPAGVVQPEGELVVNATDSNGNGPSDNTVVAYDDSVAPNAPSAVITDNGDGTITVSGSSEPGATVNVTFPDGSTGSVVVDESGNYTIDSPAGVVQPEGELVVNATDSNGNGPSDNTVVAYDDSVAPNAPSAVITDNGDGTITVSGSSEPGATVNVTFPDGSTGSVVVDESGNYTIDSPAGVVQPEGELVVNATDSNGNGPSDNTVVAYDDSVAPNAPSAVITDNGDGTITVSGSSEPGATVNVTFPDGSTGSVVVDESGNYTIDSPAGVVQPEGELVVNATDSNGNGPSDNTVVAYDDSVAPNAPSAVITDNGDGTITVSGSSEPGATVNVTFPDGSTGSVVVDESGNYTIDSPAGVVQPEGELVVNATDSNGNGPSDNTVVAYDDSVAPNAPSAVITDNGDGTITVSGSSEPGATVNVTFPDGSTGSVVVDESGNYTIDSPAGVVQPEGELVVNATDSNGNGPSDNTVVAYDDSVAPNAPSAVITDNGDGTITVSGSSEPGATVNVTFPDGSTGSVVVDESGNYTIDSPAGVVQPEGELVVNATDSNGNGPSDNTVVAYDDSVAPNAPSAVITDNGDGTITVSGSSEPGATVNVTFPDGSTGSVVVDESGNYTIDSPAGVVQPEGELVVNATDSNGNGPSDNTVVAYDDSVAPNAPSAVITDNGDGTITVSGSSEPGATVNVTFPDGSTGSVVVDESGNYTIDSPAGVVQPEGELVVNATDSNGNGPSDNTVVAYDDSVAPNAPSAVITDNGDGTITVSGSSEPGATVNVTFPDGSTGSVVVDESGNYTIDSPAGVVQPEGELVVNATDSNGNGPSDNTVVAYDDSVAPNAPSAVITDNGDGTITVSGSSEPGATVNVTFPDGSTGSVVVDESGNYTIDSPAGVVQPEGELVVNATDSNGNGPSDNTVVAYDDSVAPNAPSAVITDNGDGTITVSGSSEPGATVNVTFPDGSTGSVVVDESGNYTIDSPAGVVQPEGELVVNATDSNGNGPSDNTVVAYDDSVAPNAPSAVITDNGDGTITVSGSSEPGATVNVTFPDGSTGSVVVDESGNYTIDSPAGVVQPEGELVVNATDSNGNGPSDNTVVAYDDSVAPNAPSAVITDNGDGTITVSGSSEPGATVNVTFPDGSTGSVVVDESGNYTIDSPAGVVQPEGELVVNATDSNGNGPSDNTVVAYDDSVAPNAPSAVITDNGDGTITVSGSSEPGATVNVTFPDGSTGSVVVDESGNYTIDSPAGVVQPEGELVVNATDSNGNGPSDNTVVAYDDSVAPNAPSAVITDNGDGTITVSGSSEPGATVNVTFPDGSTGSVVVDESGNYTIDSPAGVVQPEGELVVNATDSNGNGPSDNTVVAYDDSVAPNAPSAVITDNGDGTITVSGSSEPGATVNVTFPDGSTGSVVVDESGNYTIDSPAGVVQPEGELVVNATDSNGNGPSDNTVVAYDDNVAPNAPVITVNTEAELAGTAEPGSTVIITDPSDSSTITVVADASGNWSVPNPLEPGDTGATVTATDPAGNESLPVLIDGPIDITAPTAVATLTYIGKDSGFSDTDLLTNDGSAGRLMSGTLSSVLGAGEKVQVSIDGGSTWVDAETNGADWFVMDNNTHSEDWTILSRVVDAAGNIGVESSVTVTLLEAAARPAMPQSLKQTVDSKVAVTFDPQKVVAGDRVVVTHYGVRYEHVLTEAEAAAGTAAVKTAHAPELISFTDFTYSSTEASSSVDFHGMTMHFEGQVSAGPVLKGATGGGHRKTTIDIDGGTKSVSLKLGGIDNGAQTTIYKFYDLEGQLIGTVDKTGSTWGVASGSLGTTYGHTMDFVAPEGGTIGSFTIETPEDYGGGIYLNSITLGMGAGSDVMSASIVDQAGNSSDLLWQQQLTIAEDFEWLSAQSLAIGQSRDIGSMTITALKKAFDPIYKTAAGARYWGTEGDSYLLQATAGAAVGVDFKGHAAFRFTADFFDINTAQSGQALRFYDAYDNLILSVDLKTIGANADWKANGTHTWEMPEGTSFTRFEFDAGTDWILMDNIRIDWAGEPFITPVEIYHEVHNGASYQGGGEDNIFNMADVSYFLSSAPNLDGGAGIDTLVLSGADQLLDFSALNGKINSVEVIDMTSPGNNALKLSLGDVLDQGGKDLFHLNGDVQMMVRGNSGDTVTLDDLLPNGMDPGDWANTGTISVDGVTYVSYQHSALDAQLLVEQGVTVTLV
ncbi:Ig-like domain-containing protein [Pseudomonas sp. QL9]|uniref:Ig-like domain-containing protein n=1 Tax=Pseudomonas sp. QL9 TaxID=3242725 RepID=UPI00352A2466